MGETKKTNLTISEVEEEEEKNRKKRKMPLSKVRPKNSKLNIRIIIFDFKSITMFFYFGCFFIIFNNFFPFDIC